MRLERIKKAPNSDAFYLEFEGGEKHRCYAENVADFALHSDMELTEEEYARLLEAIAFSRTRRRAARLAAARPISQGELKSKLVQKGESPENAEAAAQRLVNAGAVDDAACAEAIVRHCERRGYGPAKIKSELAAHRVPRELWQQALEALGGPEETLDRLLAAKLRGVEADRRALSKAGEYLARRGFGWEDISSALRRYGTNNVSEDE